MALVLSVVVVSERYLQFRGFLAGAFLFLELLVLLLLEIVLELLVMGLHVAAGK